METYVSHFQRDDNEVDIFSAEGRENRKQWVQVTSDTFEIAYKTLYKFHQCVVTEYRRGRIFLIGDATHINPSLGGMEMNEGINDAFDLDGRNTDFQHNLENTSVLDIYEKQRRPVVLEYVNKQSIKNKQNLKAKAPATQDHFGEFQA